jgi:hypothetical protein
MRIVEKILRSLIDVFENIVCMIEESKDLNELSIDELAGSLMAHEQRKNSKRKSHLRTCYKPRWFLRRRRYMSKRDRYASEDKAEVKWVSRAKTRKDEEEAEVAEETNPM